MIKNVKGVEIGLAKVAISNLNYIRKFKKESVEKLLEQPQGFKVKSPGVPLVKLNIRSRIDIMA